MDDKIMRSAWVEIHLDRLRHNYKQIQSRVQGSDIIAVVKADAYGHGAVRAAKTLLSEMPSAFGVSTLKEAIELRENGIDTPIIILGATPRQNLRYLIEYNLIPVVTTLKDAALLSAIAVKYQNNVSILIALETGMGRLGFLNTEDGIQAISDTLSLPGIDLYGLLSHFATADAPDPAYTRIQMQQFDNFISQLETRGIDTGYKTFANSAAIINFPGSYHDAVRPGIILYGQPPSETCRMDMDLLPVMEVKANIVYLKDVPADFAISYGATYTTSRISKIGTLPLGYADGLPRNLSNRGRVIINGRYAPIVGTICMDQCMIDVTNVPNVREYDEVIIMGESSGLKITPAEIGTLAGTINYEVICRFGQRLPKRYISG